MATYTHQIMLSSPLRPLSGKSPSSLYHDMPKDVTGKARSLRNIFLLVSQPLPQVNEHAAMDRLRAQDQADETEDPGTFDNLLAPQCQYQMPVPG